MARLCIQSVTQSGRIPRATEGAYSGAHGGDRLPRD
jgi:hypothetical protein